MKPTSKPDATFCRVFDNHFDAVTRFCLRRLPRDDVNDAVARVFVVAWRKVDEMPEGDEALPWLYRIAHYEVSTIRRSNRRLFSLRNRLSGLPRPHSQCPEAIVIRRAEYEYVVKALNTLPDKDREIILLRSYEDLSITRIAAVLGCSPDAAKKRLSRALGRLRTATGLVEPVQDIARPVRSKGGGNR